MPSGTFRNDNEQTSPERERGEAEPLAHARGWFEDVVMTEFPSPGFPSARPRRLRHHPLVRELVRETDLSPRDLVLPLFVRPGRGVRNEIASMPGNFQLS